jgi:hypothetical protein
MIAQESLEVKPSILIDVLKMGRCLKFEGGGRIARILDILPKNLELIRQREFILWLVPIKPAN